MADMGFGGNWGGSSYGAYEGEGGYTGEGSPAQLGSQEFGTQGSINNQTKANGTNPGTKGGVESALAPINLTRVISEQAISNPNTRGLAAAAKAQIDLQADLIAQQVKQASNVKAMYSQLQATEEQRADFKSGKNRGGISNMLGDVVTKGSRAVGMNEIERRGTLASDYGVNKNVTADPARIAASREVSNADKIGLGLGVLGSFIPPTPSSLIQAGVAVARYEDRMKAKGVGNPRNIDTTQTMNYGNPSMYGVRPTVPSPPEPGEGSPSDRIKPKVTARAINTNREPAMQNKTTTLVGPSRSALRSFRSRYRFA